MLMAQPADTFLLSVVATSTVVALIPQITDQVRGSPCRILYLQLVIKITIGFLMAQLNILQENLLMGLSYPRPQLNSRKRKISYAYFIRCNFRRTAIVLDERQTIACKAPVAVYFRIPAPL
jgi:hypothetical protein